MKFKENNPFLKMINWKRINNLKNTLNSKMIKL